MTGNMQSLESLDRLFASHFGSKPLISSTVNSSTRSSSIEDEEVKTPSPSGSIRSHLSYKNSGQIDTERALKLSELYKTLSSLYVDQPSAWNQSQDSHPSTNDSLKSIPLPDVFDDEQREELDEDAPYSPASSFGFPSQRGATTPNGKQPDREYRGESRRISHEFARQRLRESSSERSLNGHFSSKGQSPSGAKTPSAAAVSDSSLTSPQLRGRSESRQSTNGEMVRSPSVPGIQGLALVQAPLQDILFRITDLPNVELSDEEARELLAKSFTHLCEAPARMFGEDGAPLPPTKKEETSPEEREARKEALTVHFCGKRTHSLIKSMVIMESRTATWKRVGSAQSNASNTQPLPPNPNPWTLEFYHQDLEKLRSESKAKRAFELTESRAEGLCTTCQGKGLDACQTCKGEKADACWWCSGTGKNKNHRPCERCVGQGKLQCQMCNGKLMSKCIPCGGEGTGLYSIVVHIRVRRVDFPPVATSVILPDGSDMKDARAVQEAATQRTNELIRKLIVVSNAKAKSPFRPLTASCAWEMSTSSMVEVQVPQAAKMTLSRRPSFGSGLRRQKSTGSLRAPGFHKKIAMATRYYMLPSDPDLRPAEMSKDEFQGALFHDMPASSSSLSPPTSLLQVRRVSHSNELPSTRSGDMTPVSQAFKPHASAMAQISHDLNDSLDVSRAASPAGTPVCQVEKGDYFGEAMGRTSSSSSLSSLSSAISPLRSSRSTANLHSSLHHHRRTNSAASPLSTNLLQRRYEKSNLNLPPMPRQSVFNPGEEFLTYAI